MGKKIKNWQPLGPVERAHIQYCPACSNTDRLVLGRDRLGIPMVKCLRCHGSFHLDVRGRVLLRDGWRCQKCNAQRDLTIHHVVPREAGGRNHPGNCSTLCRGCHNGWHNHERARINRWRRVVQLPIAEVKTRVNRWRRIASAIIFRRWLA